MRINVRAFVEIAAAAFNLQGPVYEFGSFLVDGQQERANLRDVFPGRRYVGCDMRAGPGVDRVEDLAGLSLPDGCAKTVLCLDTLEHVFEARRAVDEMIRVLSPGGVLLLAAPMDFRVHDYPGDYWRLTPSCMARLLSPLEATVVGSQGLENFPHTVFGVGCKTPVSDRFARGANRLLEGFQAWLDQQQATVTWRQRLKRQAVRWFRGKGEWRRIEQFNQARFAMSMPSRVWSKSFASSEQDGEPVLLGSRVDVM